MPVRRHRLFLFTALLCAALLSALVTTRRSAASQDFWQELRPAPTTDASLQMVELGSPEQQTAELKLDDGSVEGGGLQDNLIIVNRLTPPSYPATLQRVRILFPTFNNQPDPTGKAIKLLIATDSSGSGSAPALANYTIINTTVPGASLTNFFEITIPNGPTITGGDFYIGYQTGAPHQGVGFALDANNSNTQAQNRSYISLDNGASFNVITPPSGAVSAIAMMRAVVSLPNVTSAPAIDVAPTALNFGNITVNASLDQSLTIRNTGAAALTVSALTSSNLRFSFLSTTLPFTLTAGQQQALTVRFIPTVAQSETGTLTINSNDPTRASLTVPVTGAGFTPGSNAIALSSGAPQNGQIAGSSQSGLCSIGVTQYTIAVPAGAASLQIALTSNLDLDLYARFNNPILVQAGQVAADFRATSLGGNETISISPTTAPALQAGTYYLAISNCTTSTANFTLTATVSTNTTGQITEDLGVDDGTPESGLRGDGAFFVNRLTPSRYPSRLQRVRIYFAQISGQPDPSNQSIRLLVFNNPTFNSLPQTPSYLLDRQVTIPQITTPRYVEYDITENVSITEGDWVVGFQSPNPANGVACVVDASSTFQNRSFAKLSGPTNWLSMNANGMIRAVAVSGTQPTCTYAIAPTSQNFAAAGGSDTVNVTAPTGCAWTAASNAAWLSITSGASGSGNGSVAFTVAANQLLASRTGTLTVAGQTFTITQAGVVCTYVLSPNKLSFSNTGGDATIRVISNTACTFTAVSNANWLYLVGGHDVGYVRILVVGNTTPSERIGTLTIAGLTLTVTQDAPYALSSVSAASYQSPLAPDSIATIFGTAGLARLTEVATTNPLPTNLAGTTVRVRDSAGTELLAPLFFVSATQVNYLIPAGLLAGNATVLVRSGLGGALSFGTITLANLAPGIFTANASGNGVAAGLALRVKADGSQVYEPILQLDAASGRYVPLPIDLGSANEQVFLILFGTGFRNVTRLADVAIQIGGADAETLYAGRQGELAGLDQLNIRLNRNLAGRGELDVLCNVTGRNANTVRISVK